MKMFNLFGKNKETQVDPIANFMYNVLCEEKYTQRPYQKQYLGENMYIINEAICGYMKPRYLVDERNKTAVEFMDEMTRLQTVSNDDIDWESLKDLPQEAIDRAKNLNAIYPSFICKYKNDVAEVSWQLNPDGRYFMDEDGYGMTDDEEITIYGYVDRAGKPLVKFRHINDYSELDEMEKEARCNLETRKMSANERRNLYTSMADEALTRRKGNEN